jgi:hypothetical protein
MGASAALLLVACGSRTGLRTTGDATPSSVGGVVLNSCAPNDAPALWFSLGASTGTSTPTCQVPGISAGVSILIWNPIPQGPGTFAIGDGSFSSGSSGYVCDAAQTCGMATGTLVLTELTATSASGSYTLTNATQTVSASFEGIEVCASPALCG